MALTILSVAYALSPVGPDASGGAEQILSAIDRALVRAGHRSIVVAMAGSEAAGTLLEGPPLPALIDDHARDRALRRHDELIRKALARWPVDLIHMHGLDFLDYLPPPGPPMLATLHLPLDWYPPEALAPPRPGTWLNCVSAAQRKRAPFAVDFLPDIENGVAVDRLAARHAKRNFVLALGRICPEKGLHLAIDAARAARMPILVAGQLFPYPEHQRYFRQEIEPRLGPGARYLGPLGFARKRRLMSAARAVLIPSLAPETSSLVAMEALACGTPVIAFPSGALADIVEPAVTGFLVQDAEEMGGAVAAAAALDPRTCRQVAERRFSLDRMIARYLALYEQLAVRRTGRAMAAQ